MVSPSTASTHSPPMKHFSLNSSLSFSKFTQSCMAPDAGPAANARSGG